MENTLAVIIPAYNEEQHIENCIEKLIDQADYIDEIIVVDNNSTDSTVKIVEKTHTRKTNIRVIRESRQGVAYAAYTGYDSATSTLLARIDAETFVEPGWAHAIVEFFDQHGDDYSGGAGLSTLHDMPFQSVFRKLQKKVVAHVEKSMAGGKCVETSGMIGGNGVVSAEAWRLIRQDVSYRRDVHENTDMSLCLTARGRKIAVIPRMLVKVSGRRYASNPVDYFKYASCETNAFRLHGMRGKVATTWVTVFAACGFQLFMWLPARSYDPDTGKLSWARLRSYSEERVLPVSSSESDLA